MIVGTLTLGAALMAAYSILESRKVGTKDPVELSKSNKDLQEYKVLREKNVMSSIQESDGSPNMEPAGKNTVTHSDLPQHDDLSKTEEIQFQVNDEPQSTHKEDVTPVQEKLLPSMTSDDESKTSGASLGSTLDMKSTEVKSIIEQHEAVESTPILPQGNTDVEENDIKSVSIQQQTATNMPEVHGDSVEQPKSLLNEYNLGDKDEETISTLSDKHKDLVAAIEDSNDAYLSKDGKLVLDFLQAIHAAEKRQAELDAQIFAEEKRKMKEKYEKGLKDARARELMYAEEAALMDKELNRERLKAAAALKSLREELEDNLRIELEQKETEAELQLKKIQELAKAELAAAIANEKASQIEKMAEANLHVRYLLKLLSHV
jgi:mitofilin